MEIQTTQFTNGQQAVLVAALIVVLAVVYLLIFMFMHSPAPEQKPYDDVFLSNQKPAKAKGVKHV